jgi:hypothetical protein
MVNETAKNALLASYILIKFRGHNIYLTLKNYLVIKFL